MTKRFLFISLAMLFSATGVLGQGQSRDGIPDDWKTNGVTVAFADGHTRFLDLPGKGASPRHKDVIVWITWMDAPDHSHKPVASTTKASDGSGQTIENVPLGRVIQAFKNAPVKNLDGTTGINLILIYSDMKPIVEVPQIGTTDPNGIYDWSELEKLTLPQFPTGPPGIAQAIHLCTFIHQMGGESLFYTGLSKTIPGHEFLVSLGGSSDQTGTSDQQVGTFMHELGHNLGLSHGGADDILYKPNYLSVLNYLFQVTGLMEQGTLGHFDYSRQKFDFDEHSVDGTHGVSQDPALEDYGSAETCDQYGSKFRYYPSLSAPIKWDCTDDDPIPGVQPKDVNRDGFVQLLTGWDDWASIILAPSISGAGAGMNMFKTPKPRDELDVRRIATIFAGLTVPSVSVTNEAGGIRIRWSRVPLESVVAYEVLRYRPGAPPDVIRQTKSSEFLDTTGIPGVTYNYQVRLVVNGFSSEAIDRAASIYTNVHALQAGMIRSVLSTKHAISDTLMLSTPTRTIKASR
jgi:prepilin-type processing-associated H-X9-DG protein